MCLVFPALVGALWMLSVHFGEEQDISAAIGHIVVTFSSGHGSGWIPMILVNLVTFPSTVIRLNVSP